MEHPEENLLSKDYEKLLNNFGTAYGENKAHATINVKCTLDICRALDYHSEKLKDASEASDRYAKNLMLATWALVIATAGLFITNIFF